MYDISCSLKWARQIREKWASRPPPQPHQTIKKKPTFQSSCITVFLLSFSQRSSAMSKQLPSNLFHCNQIIQVKELNRWKLQGASKYQKQITGKNWLLMWSLRGQTALLVIQTHERSRMHPGYTKEAGKPQTIFFLVSFQRDNLLHTPTPYSQKGQIFHFSSTAGSTFLTFGYPMFLESPCGFKVTPVCCKVAPLLDPCRSQS